MTTDTMVAGGTQTPAETRADIAAAFLPGIKATYIKQNGKAGQKLLDEIDAELAK